MTLLHLPQEEGVQVADHQLLGHPSMLFMCTCFLFLVPTYHIRYLLMHFEHFRSTFFKVMVLLMLEEEDHQLEGRGVEAKEEVLQDLLLCSMCRNDHCLEYVITSE